MTGACPTRKIPYVSRSEARQVLKHGGQKLNGNHVYHCRHCDMWHLGRRNR